MRSYGTPALGIAATLATLNNGRYGNILAALRNGSSAMGDARAVANSPWGTGSLVEKILGAPGAAVSPSRAPGIPNHAPGTPGLSLAVLELLSRGNAMMGLPALPSSLAVPTGGGAQPSPGSLVSSQAPFAVPANSSATANPVPNSSFERVDQGVDFMSRAPVHALGAGTIESVSKGMAGGTGDIIKERLDRPVTVNGHTYQQVYYSEQAPLVRQGQHVAAGAPVMAPGGNEIGFLMPDGSFPPLVGGLGAGTQPTQQGRDFLAFLRSLGVS